MLVTAEERLLLCNSSHYSFVWVLRPHKNKNNFEVTSPAQSCFETFRGRMVVGDNDFEFQGSFRPDHFVPANTSFYIYWFSMKNSIVLWALFPRGLSLCKNLTRLLAKTFCFQGKSAIKSLKILLFTKSRAPFRKSDTSPRFFLWIVPLFHGVCFL